MTCSRNNAFVRQFSPQEVKKQLLVSGYAVYQLWHANVLHVSMRNQD